MHSAFCTIITSSYIHYALALRKSIYDKDKNISFYILVSDQIENLNKNFIDKYPGTFVFSINEVCSGGLGKSIYDKYYKNDVNAFRWSMKPVFIKYLLEKHDYQKVIYTDADIYFFDDYHFLLDELDIYEVLLSPHWRTCNPHVDPINFGILYTSGLFNGGFIGTNKNALPALDWWAMATEYICVINPSIGMFGDQVHLNLLPVYFDHVGILKHRGCNVANWNMVECSRTLAANNATVIIADKYPIVFIHFTESTINGIVSGVDGLLLPYLKKYYESLNFFAKECGCPEITFSLPQREKSLSTKRTTGMMKIKKMLKRSIQ